jgi:hypothetical protein
MEKSEESPLMKEEKKSRFGEHGPENAEHEIKKAYNCAIETAVAWSFDRKPVEGLNPGRVEEMYRTSFDALRDGDKLIAERWARTAKHLSRAFWHEAKIAYLEPRATELPFLEKADAEYNLHEYSDTTADLLASVSEDLPPGYTEMPEEMALYISRGKKMLGKLESINPRQELLRAEYIKAAHEYGRVVECLALALEAELLKKKKAA